MSFRSSAFAIVLSLISMTAASVASGNAFEERVASVHPSTFVDLNDVSYDGMRFLALAGGERLGGPTRQLIGKRADALCRFLKYSSALNYDYESSEKTNFLVIERGRRIVSRTVPNYIIVPGRNGGEMIYSPSAAFTKLRCKLAEK
ncbi:MAG: hypothetical protein AB1540_12930 [Bdellovibrionota bacterium]